MAPSPTAHTLDDVAPQIARIGASLFIRNDHVFPSHREMPKPPTAHASSGPPTHTPSKSQSALPGGGPHSLPGSDGPGMSRQSWPSHRATLPPTPTAHAFVDDDPWRARNG